MVTWRSVSAALLLALAGAGCAGSSPDPRGDASDTVRGVVFHDRDGDGRRGRWEFGLHGVAVSNGREVVRTNWHGRYRLPISDDSIVFVVKPCGYATPVNQHELPRFHRIHKPAGSPAGLRYPGVPPTGPLPASVDFPLTRQRERDRFEVLVFGDTQPYTTHEIDLFSRDVLAELIGTDAAFGISLGDLVGDDLSLFDPLNAAIGQLGIPWYNVPGNHDMNYLAKDDAHADETFERVFGPGTYAFEYASVHFVILDDVVYGGATGERATTQNYVGGLSDDQLSFVRNYLAGVPRDHLVVVAMHIPLDGPGPRLDVPQRGELLEILAEHPNNLSIAGHLHTQGHRFFGADDGYPAAEPHHHWIAGTTSGSWWLGVADELGIPHATMRDGTPNGYAYLAIDGNSYKIRYKAARRPADYQMNVFLPDTLSASAAKPREVLVNVFAGSEQTLVEMRLAREDSWTPLQRVLRPSPDFVELRRREAAGAEKPDRPLPPADPSTHLWRGTLPAVLPVGSHTLLVRATDPFGGVFRARRILRVEDIPADETP
ncbi:MAG: calcineurin-like phosphoesterase C-terminal domain-containing protein [Myxococcota bacterium]